MKPNLFGYIKLPDQDLFDDFETGRFRCWCTDVSEEVLEERHLDGIGARGGAGMVENEGREETEREEPSLWVW